MYAVPGRAVDVSGLQTVLSIVRTYFKIIAKQLHHCYLLFVICHGIMTTEERGHYTFMHNASRPFGGTGF